MGKQNRKSLENIKRYEEEKVKQSKSKVLGQKLVKEKPIKEKKLMCTTHNGVKVYGIWYK